MPDVVLLMGCGHWANGTHHEQPACVICAGVVAGALVPAEHQPVFPMTFRCLSCDRQVTVNGPEAMRGLAFPALPRGEGTTGSFYCGCRGWD